MYKSGKHPHRAHSNKGGKRVFPRVSAKARDFLVKTRSDLELPRQTRLGRRRSLKGGTSPVPANPFSALSL